MYRFDSAFGCCNYQNVLDEHVGLLGRDAVDTIDVGNESALGFDDLYCWNEWVLLSGTLGLLLFSSAKQKRL